MKGVITNCLSTSLRTEPDEYGRIKDVLVPFDVVEIVPDKSTEDWHYVITEDLLEGYVKKKFVSIIKET